MPRRADIIDRLLEALVEFNAVLLYLLTSAFMALETSLLLGLLMPGDSLLLAGTTVTSPVRFAAQVTASTLGSLLGESIGYLLGRRYGRRVRHSPRGRRLRPDAWAKAERSSAGAEDPRWQPPGLSRSSCAGFRCRGHGRHPLPALPRLECSGGAGLVCGLRDHRRGGRSVLAAVRATGSAWPSPPSSACCSASSC